MSKGLSEIFEEKFAEFLGELEISPLYSESQKAMLWSTLFINPAMGDTYLAAAYRTRIAELSARGAVALQEDQTGEALDVLSGIIVSQQSFDDIYEKWIQLALVFEGDDPALEQSLRRAAMSQLKQTSV